MPGKSQGEQLARLTLRESLKHEQRIPLWDEGLFLSRQRVVHVKETFLESVHNVL
jgi:hypothetical protein